MKYSAMIVILLASVDVFAADFILTGNDHLDADDSVLYDNGWMYDTSSLTLSGHVRRLTTYDDSTVDIIGQTDQEQWVIERMISYERTNIHVSGGLVYNLELWGESILTATGIPAQRGNIQFLEMRDSSKAYIDGGTADEIQMWDGDETSLEFIDGYSQWVFARDKSIVNMHGGDVSNMYLYPGSTLTVDGRSVSQLYLEGSYAQVSGGLVDGWIHSGTLDIIAGGDHNIELDGADSVVNFTGGRLFSLTVLIGTMNIYPADFSLGSGLWLVGNEIEGEGILSGHWPDGGFFNMPIIGNSHIDAHIFIPEPSALSLLGLSGLILIRRKH